jgi:hypothetical protein
VGECETHDSYRVEIAVLAPVECLSQSYHRLGPPAFRPAFEHVPMMQKPVEHGTHCRNVGQ